MNEIFQYSWHWSFSGFMLALVMFLLLMLGKSFGLSSTLRTVCAAGGAGAKISFFDYDWKAQKWNLLFVLGAVIGGFIASNFMMGSEPISISSETISHLQAMGVDYQKSAEKGTAIVPVDLFSFEVLFSFKGFMLFVVGGFLVGFGARYAGGCTSGHAISGLSNFQIPSLISVIGFFIGGILMTHFILPFIFSF